MQLLGINIISILQSKNMVVVGDTFSNSTWRNISSNHMLAAEFCQICELINCFDHDRILWDGNVSRNVGISVIRNTIRSRKTPPIWVDMVWNKFSVHKYSINL